MRIARRAHPDRLARGRGHPGGAVARTCSAREKPDHSPVTAADEASEAVILEGLARLLPGCPGGFGGGGRATMRPRDSGRRFLLVDPLDGTREFLAGRDEFTVNIALVEDGVPVAGVIAAPARGLIWRGRRRPRRRAADAGAGAAPKRPRERMPIRTRARPATGARVLLSRSHLDAATVAYVDRLPQPERIACGSSLKFCLIAEGAADLYPRLAPTVGMGRGRGPRGAAGRRRRGRATPTADRCATARATFAIPAFIAFGDRGTPLPAL